MSSEAARGGPDSSVRTGERGQLPDRPTTLSGRAGWDAIKRAVAEFRTDNLTDWAAALTYYSVLSIFPALLVLISLVGLAGQSATQTLIDHMSAIAPGPAKDILTQAVENLQKSQGAAGLVFVIGLLG